MREDIFWRNKMEKKGKFIVIEGGDGAGKETQAKLLVAVLLEKGSAAFFDFPQYEDTVFGKLIGKCLSGEFGDFLNMSPYLSSLPYALDRASAKDKMKQALLKGHVVCNRYVSSNIAYQSAKLPEHERDAFIQFLETGEYEEVGLPRPDAVVYLEVPEEISSELILQKIQRVYLAAEQAKDQHEKDMEYQGRVRAVYQKLATERSDWHIVECAVNGLMASREAIHKKIINLLVQEVF